MTAPYSTFGRRRIKILNLISTLDTGGAETFLSRLVTNMDRFGFKNSVVSMTDMGPVGRTLASAGISVYSLNMAKGMPDIRGLWQLVRLIRQEKPNIIHCWMYHANLLGLAVKPLFPRIKVLWNIRCSNMEWGAYGRVYDYTVRAGAILSRLPDGIIYNSEAGRQVHNGLGYQNAYQMVIHNGIDTRVFQSGNKDGHLLRQELDIPDHGVVITCVARFDPMKDHQTLFRAAQRVLDKNSDAHFVMAGRGMTRDNPVIQTYMADIKHPANIHLLGERSDISRIYAGSDMACSSSYGEGFSNAIAEAMATGLPCIVTDVGDSALIVGDTGRVVPSRNPDAFADAILDLMKLPPDKFQALGKKAACRIQSRFNLIRCISQYEKIIRFS